MDPIGSSPVFIHKEDLRRVAPIWHDVTLKIKQDREADKGVGVGPGDVRLHHREQDCRRSPRFAPGADGAAAVG